MGAAMPLTLLLATIAAFAVATTVANTLWPVILRDHPALLPALDGRNRYLVLSSAKVGAAVLIVVGVTRRLAGHVAYYLLGRWYGEAALAWVARRSRFWGRIVTRYEPALAWIAQAAVLVSSSNIARTLAAATGMSRVRFAIVEAVGTVLQMLALFALLNKAGKRVPSTVDVLDSHASGLTALLILLCLGWAGWRVARRRSRRLPSPGNGVEER